MADQNRKQADLHPDEALEHMEKEFHDLEGDTAGGKWIKWVIGLLALGAVVAAFWFFPSAEPEAPVVAGGLVIQTLEPRQGKLNEAPAGFRWESIAGRYDYVVKVFVEGAPSPLFERQVKEPLLRLTTEERGQIQGGKSYVWTVAARRRDGSAIGTGKAKFQLP